ncbi:hypothetical protein [Microbacterium sp. E-13]|uniref:hypothetical protein n=1 Tax=Microbacterium sp. E-13 TaxID=3404048 RepID=UPI003CFAB754
MNELLRSRDVRALTELPDDINRVRAELSPAPPSADVLRDAFEWSREHLDPNAEWRNPLDLRRLTPLFDDHLKASEEFLVIPLAERVGVRTSTNRFVVAESLVADIHAWRRWVTGRHQLPIVDMTAEL